MFAIKIIKRTCFYFRLLRIKLKYLGHIIVKLANRFYLFLELIKLVKGNITHKTNKFLSSLNYNWHNHAENVNAKKKYDFMQFIFFYFTLLYLLFLFFYFNFYFNLVFYLTLEAESKAYIFLGPVFVVHGLKRFHLAYK